MPSCCEPTALTIASSAGDYPVRIEAGLLDATLGCGGDRFFLADAAFGDRFAAAGVPALFVTAEEGAKSLDRMAEVIVALRQAGATRSTRLVAVGGGVVQDIAAFAASIYMRGLDWSYVPTTLLAMTDSCIGGKSSINVGAYKNLVGTFHPPAEVLVDPTLTATLSIEQRAAGLCEAAKIAFCRGEESWAAYQALRPNPAVDDLSAVIALSLRAKQWFIEVDEFDRAERLLLNFGHTFGHALEAATGFAISHGIAVGLGMLAAFRLGELMGRRYEELAGLAAFRRHIADLVSVAPGLGRTLATLDAHALLRAFAADKKHRRDGFAVIVVDENGRVERRFLPRDAASERLISQAFQAMIADRLGYTALAA